MNDTKKTLQLQIVLAQHFVAGVPKGPYGLEEMKAFQEHLYTRDPPFQIKVFCDQTVKPLYTGPIKTTITIVSIPSLASSISRIGVTIVIRHSIQTTPPTALVRVKHTEPKKKGKEGKGRKREGKEGKGKERKGGKERKERKGKWAIRVPKGKESE